MEAAFLLAQKTWEKSSVKLIFGLRRKNSGGMRMTAEKEFDAKCNHCGSDDVYGMSRVVGYYSKINNWNTSKKAEFKDRQKGNYCVDKP
jgi:hypothetical protein